MPGSSAVTIATSTAGTHQQGNESSTDVCIVQLSEVASTGT